MSYYNSYANIQIYLNGLRKERRNFGIKFFPGYFL